MQYVMLIFQGPALERQAALSEAEQKQVYADYQALNKTPGVTPVPPLGLAENATTVRVEDGRTLERLALLGCDLAQGFHVGAPMSGDAFDAWLAHRSLATLDLRLARQSANAAAVAVTPHPSVIPGPVMSPR